MQEAARLKKRDKKDGTGAPLDVSKARSLGAAARVEGKPPEACPYSDYPGRSFKSAWFEGYEEAAPRRPLPVVHVQSVEVVTTGTFWPKGEKLPTHSIKPKDQPCPKCLMVRLSSGAEAVSRGSKAVYKTAGPPSNAPADQKYQWHRCRNCDHTWQLPVKEV